METSGNVPVSRSVDVYMIRVGETAEREGLRFAETIRNEVSGLKLQVNCAAAVLKVSLKKQTNQALNMPLFWAMMKSVVARSALNRCVSEQGQQTLSRSKQLPFCKSFVG